MSNYKLFSLAAAVFLVMAAISGGGTVAVLSDSATVTTTITVGNTGAGNVGVTAETSESASTAGNPSTSTLDTSTNTSGSENDTVKSQTTQDVNSSENDTETSQTTQDGFGNITIALEPADRTADSDSTVVYNVVVENAAKGIGGYSLQFELSNASVATFEGFTHTAQPDPMINNTTTADGVLRAEAWWGSDSVEGADRITVGKLRVTAEAAGETDITIVGLGSETRVVLNDAYYIGATQDGTLEVTESDGSNETS